MNLKDNPFFLLDASPRDSKEMIHEKAENISFEIDENACRNAELILLNPKKRLEAEISWFPGMPPGKTKELLSLIQEKSQKRSYDPEIFCGLNKLSHANALAFFLSNLSGQYFDQHSLKEIIKDFCVATNMIDGEQVFRLINEDRSISGFTKISDKRTIEQCIQNLMHWYKGILYSFLVGFDSCIEVLTLLIEESTDNGKIRCNWVLLDDIISEYETDAIPLFEEQEELINADINEIKKSISNNSSYENLSGIIGKLENDVYLWDKIAQPIQVLYKSKGMIHKRSSELAQKLRALSIAIYNKSEKANLSERISLLLLDVFAEVPLVEQKISDDLQILRSNKNQILMVKIKEIIEKYDQEPSTRADALKLFQECWDEAMPLVNNLCDVRWGKNYLASFFLCFAVNYANRVKDYPTSHEILKKIYPLISDDELLDRFKKNMIILEQNLVLKKINAEGHLSSNILTSIIIFFVFGIIGIIVAIFNGHGSRSIFEGFLGGDRGWGSFNIITICIIIEPSSLT